MAEQQKSKGMIEAEKRIAKALEENAQTLNLLSLGLTDKNLVTLSENLSKLTNLTKLYLSHNKITEIPESVTKLIKGLS